MFLTGSENEQKTDRSRTFRRQLFVVLTVSVGTFLTGSTIGWMSPALRSLQSNTSHIKLTSEEGSWLALYPEFGHFMAPVLTGYITDVVGRKAVFIIGGIFTTIGWSLKVIAGNLNTLYTARILLGISYGITMTVAHIYVAEVVSKDIRGTFSSLLFVTLNMGILFEFIIGSYLSFKTTALVTAIISGSYLLSLFFIVESPYYYVARKRNAEAKQTMIWFKGSFNEESMAELDSLKNQMNKKFSFSRAAVKSFLLCLFLSFLSDITGRPAVITYAMQSFPTDSYLSPTGFTILLGSLNTCLPLIPTLLTDRVGRKVIIVVAAIFGGIMQLCTGLLYYLHDVNGIPVPAYGWLLFITITAYLCSCSVFVTNVLTLRGELISESSRGLVSGTVSMAYALAIIITIKTFQVVRDNLGLHYAFWVLSIWSLIFVIFTSTALPETKGKTLSEIQQELGRKK